jgi:hypothetical protein
MQGDLDALYRRIEELEQRVESQSCTITAIKMMLSKKGIVDLKELEDRQFLEWEFYCDFKETLKK